MTFTKFISHSKLHIFIIKILSSAVKVRYPIHFKQIISFSVQPFNHVVNPLQKEAKLYTLRTVYTNIRNVL